MRLKSAVEMAACKAVEELASMRELRNAFARLDADLRVKCIRRVARVMRQALATQAEAGGVKGELLGDAWQEVFVCQEGIDAVMDALEAMQEHLFLAADKLLSSTQTDEGSQCKASKHNAS